MSNAVRVDVSQIEKNTPKRPFFSPEPDDSLIGIGDAFALFRRHSWLVLITILIGTISTIVTAYRLPDIFVATSTIVLERNDRRLLEADPNLDRQDLNRSAIETEIDIIKSRGFAGQVVDKFNLVEDPALNPYLPKADGKLTSWYQQLWSVIWDKLGIKTESRSKPKAPELAVQRQHTITAFLSNLTVKRSGESLAMSIGISHPSATAAAELANGVTNHYVERSVELRKAANNTAVAILRGRAEKLASIIATSEGKVAELRRAHQLNKDGDDLGDQLRAEVAQLKTRLGLLEKKRDDFYTELGELERISKNSEDGLATVEVESFSSLVSLKNEEAALMDEVRLALVGNQQPTELINTNEKLTGLREKIKAEVQHLVNYTTGKARLTDATIAQLEVDFEQLETRLKTRNEAEITLNKLERELLSDRERYNQILQGLGILDLQAEILNPGANIVSAAEIPSEAAYPKRKTIIIGGFLGSAMLAVILTLMVEGLNKKLRTEKQTRRVTRLPNLAYIPQISRKWWQVRRQPHEYIAQQHPSFFTEAVRSLYLSCSRRGFEFPPKVIMLTSSLPDEGKTCLALSLASTAAANGQRTALVDLDLHRNGISRVLNLENQRSSPEKLTLGEQPLSDITQTNEALPGVDIIAFSEQSMKRSAFLSSNQIREMFLILRSRYDIIFVDTPPILIVNDASWLSPLVDTAILVVRWGKTTEDALSDAARQLRMYRVPMIGTVINRVNPIVHARQGYGGSLAYYKYAKNYYSY